MSEGAPTIPPVGWLIILITPGMHDPVPSIVMGYVIKTFIGA